MQVWAVRAIEVFQGENILVVVLKWIVPDPATTPKGPLPNVPLKRFMAIAVSTGLFTGLIDLFLPRIPGLADLLFVF